MMSENDQIIDGWIFSSSTRILTSPLGQTLKNSMKNKTGIKLWGSVEENQGTYIIFTKE